MADIDPRLFPALPNAGGSFSSDDKRWIMKEVESGLRNHRPRLASAIENQAFYDLESDRYQPRREAETEFDFAGRPRRQSGFVQQAVDRLCEHTYNPGPTRTVVGDNLADGLLEQVYETNHIDCVMQHAECQATLNDVCAVQVKCTNDPDKPVDLQLWGGDEFTVFTDPEDPRQAFAVVTIDRYNQRTRYRLWFEDEIRTYLTDQYSADKTAGARVAYAQKDAEKNTYGCIPFAFLHYRAPVRQFWTPGPGTFLRKAELRINDRLSELDELIMKFGRPVGVFKNVGVTFTPEIGPGRFMRLNRGGTGYTGEGYADGGEPSAEYLQAQLAIESIWVDLEKYIKQVATAVNLPYTALELEYSDAPSGISLIIKSAPLLTRARQRRPIYQLAEMCLARKILTSAGNHYGQAGLVTQAKQLQLLLAWAEPRIPIPGPDRDQSDEWEMQVGIKSRITVCMERYGLTRDQAVDHIKQVTEDEQEVKEILPQELTPPASETMPSEEQDQRQAEQADEDATRGAEQAGESPDPTKASD
ncbi:MAG TPA: hypothetical protein VKF17_16750 [Isosphaeraceae bacterium]|nr:hypothetical protein [Isosphaeraceae bacterium]